MHGLPKKNAEFFDYGRPLSTRRRCAVPWCGRPGMAARPGERFKASVPLCERHSLCTRCGAPIYGMKRTGSGLITDCCGHWEANLVREAWRIPWTRWLRTRKTERRTQVEEARIIVAGRVVCTGLPFPEDV